MEEIIVAYLLWINAPAAISSISFIVLEMIFTNDFEDEDTGGYFIY